MRFWVYRFPVSDCCDGGLVLVRWVGGRALRRRSVAPVVIGWGGGWAIILLGLDSFLIFSRSATRQATRIYHVYK